MTSLNDLLSLSRRVAADAPREPEITRAAIAWTFLNRAREARAHMRRRAAPHPWFGDGTLSGTGLCYGAPLSAHRFTDPALCRALATVCMVSCRDLADPAGGATHYHHHREAPAWSAQLVPVALLGSYLFYRPARPG
ncbi:MAG: hypothetical protein ACLFWF_11710 [Alphaproteobacteria bacterium]